MVPYRQDPEHIAPANQAPRCQHIRMNGRRCGSPALRGESRCYFHNRIQDRALAAEDVEPFLPFIEDATSLQFALMRVMRLLQIGHSFEYKRCALLLYSLQIAASNLKAFMAEQPKSELAESEQPRPERAPSRQGKVDGKNGDEARLAGLLVGILGKGGNGNSAKQPPRICSRADSYPAVAQKPGPEPARPGRRSSLAAG